MSPGPSCLQTACALSPACVLLSPRLCRVGQCQQSRTWLMSRPLLAPFVASKPEKQCLWSKQNTFHSTRMSTCIPTRHNLHSTAISYWGSFYLPVITPDTFFNNIKTKLGVGGIPVFKLNRGRRGFVYSSLLSQVALVVLLYCFFLTSYFE